jgi:hypothetical protein
MKRLLSDVGVALFAAGLLSVGCRATAASDQTNAGQSLVTSDRALKSEIEAAATSAALEQVLVRHPDQGQLIVPRIEALTIAEIRRDGPGSRFAIEELTPDDGPGRSVTLEAVGRSTTVLREFPGDAFDTPQGASPSASFGDGSIHRYIGRVAFAPELTIFGDGDRNYRLTFAILAGYGMVYLRGTGRVVISVEGQQKTIQFDSPQ